MLWPVHHQCFWQILSSLPPLLLDCSPLHCLLFPTMLSEHHHQDGRRYGGIWERSWLRPYSPSWGMVTWVHAFGRTHERKVEASPRPACRWLCVFPFLSFFGKPDAPCKTTGGGGGSQLTMLKVLALAPSRCCIAFNAGQMFVSLVTSQVVFSLEVIVQRVNKPVVSVSVHVGRSKVTD